MASETQQQPALTAADLVYDPDAHMTRTPSGVVVPHVTGILASVGVTTDFEAISSLGRRAANYIEAARYRGTAVHADCHAYDDDDLVLETVDHRVLPYLEAWAQVRRDKGLVPLVHARERHLFNPLHWYAGIQDGIFMRAERRRVLVDLKTGDPEHAAAHLQTAAYEQAWLAEHADEPVDERWAVWLRPGRRIPYTIIDYTARPDSWADFGKFLSCLTTFNEQPGRRRPIR